MGKAIKKSLIDLQCVDLRSFGIGKHRVTDSKPFGGGPGMVLRADVLTAAWRYAHENASCFGTPLTVLLSPQGKLFNNQLARQMSQQSPLILICGHYEGIDQRFIEQCVQSEISIGDYICTGGELPAMVILDTICRFIPRVVQNPLSVNLDSFENGLLKHPQYTLPREFEGKAVPEVLLSGNHQRIEQWEKTQALLQTEKKRPGLFKTRPSKI